MQQSFPHALYSSFLGHSPNWYKLTIVAFLLLNPLIYLANPYVAGWALVIEFIFTLAMALKCYPLLPGGLLAFQAVVIGMTSPDQIMHEIAANLEVLLLLIFMVAGIYFMKGLLLFVFTKIITKVKSKSSVSLLFCAASAFLSAFLDALTVMAVIISVAIGFYSVYHKIASGKQIHHDDHDHTDDQQVQPLSKKDLKQFRGYLRNLLMHAGVGTALGGVMTIVGEPQNLIIGHQANWDFIEFFMRMSVVTIPVFIAGMLTCFLLEKLKWFGYGVRLSPAVRQVLEDYDKHQAQNRTTKDKAKLFLQGLIAIWLIVGLAFHLAAVGLIGLSVIIFATTFTGVTDEAQIGHAFEEALPFTALLAVFFAIVAVIIDQKLFEPVIHWVLTFEGNTQLVAFYLANGLLSMVSDNVFVGTVYITEVKNAFLSGAISRDQFDLLAVAINTGTNLPSVATPNGQAAFLFLLTSALAPLIRLSYGRMVYMALPYTFVLTFVGLLAIGSGEVQNATQYFYDKGWIIHHSDKNLPNSHLSEKSSGH
jgi:NhaB family Na+:H+ antiporter